MALVCILCLCLQLQQTRQRFTVEEALDMLRGCFNSTESNGATTTDIATKDSTLPEETAVAADTTESLAAAADVPAVAADIVQQLAQAAPAEADNARQHLV
jgi:hypothetical protein